MPHLDAGAAAGDPAAMTIEQTGGEPRPSGYTIDGVRWEEPRGPHLPDPLIRQPRLMWPFLAFALLLAFQAAARLEQASTSVAMTAELILRSILIAVPPVSIPLLGVAWFRRRPTPTIRDAMSVAVALLAGAEGMRFVSPWVVDWLANLDIHQVSDFATLRLASIWSTLAAAVSILGGLFVLRAVQQARRRPDSERQRSAFLLLGIATVVIVAVQVWFVWTAAVPDDGTGFGTNLTALAISCVSITITAILAAVLLGGVLAGETPRIAWQLGALAYAVQIGGLLINSLALLAGGALQSFFELYQWSILVTFAVGAVALVAAVALGLPPVEMPDPTGSAVGEEPRTPPPE
jgi:hypothetical protein